MAPGAGDPAWFEDRFRGPDLDPDTWFPYYLPAWSSRGQSRASYRVDGDGLTLEGQAVLEEQERFEGWLPAAGQGGGRVEISARMQLSPRSMAALWMSGFEDD